MTRTLRLAVTADLHWGPNPRGNEATELLVAFLKAQPPDLLIVAGDVGAADDFDRCLALFDQLHCRKALVPGNHDIWVTSDDQRGDSLRVYQEHLPALCAAHDFHYFDRGPLVLPEFDLAFVGSINWYDYSWSIERLREQLPDWEERLRKKSFTRGRHNDARFVRWELDDVRFTAQVVASLEQQLHVALAQADKAIVTTHHPPLRGLNYPRPDSPSPDGLLWEAFSGNAAMEALLTRYADRIPFVFCGHTHREREQHFQTMHGFNVGGDYHFKRLLLVDWPAGTLDAHVFGNPEIRS